MQESNTNKSSLTKLVNDLKRKSVDKANKVLEHKFSFSMLGIFMGLYYLVFARPIFTKKYIFAGDTQYLWGAHYTTFLSLKNFNALPWWDPTAYNGFPFYYHFTFYWSNYLSPFYLPSLILFKITSGMVSINSYIIFHQTLYVVFLNVIAIYLISRQLVVNKIAAVLPVLIFCFSHFQILNLHDSPVLEATIAPLFYLYALIRYNNNRTAKNLLLLLLFIGTLSADLHFQTVTSAFFWASIFTFLLIVFNFSILKDTFVITRNLTRSLKGKIALTLAMLLIITAVFAATLSFHYNKEQVIRYRGDVVNYTTDAGVSNHSIDIETTRIWTIISNWVPFPEIHEKLFKYAWDGHDYRYIGLITIPLILAAFTLGLKNRYVFILFLTYFLCNGFIVYTVNNVAYRVLIENSNIFSNLRNMMTVFPRGGPIFFLVFLSSIGLDCILGMPDKLAGNIESHSFDKILTGGFKLLLLCGAMAIVCGVLVSIPKIGLYEARHSLFHIGFYLFTFSFLCWILFLSENKLVKNCIFICLLVFTFTDLIISVSHNIDEIDVDHYHNHVGRIPYSVASERNILIPDNTDLLPANSKSERMFSTNYRGFYHNCYELFSGKKAWLVLASRKKGLNFLPAWNPITSSMTKYPTFAFFSNGYYLPFESIKTLDSNEEIFDRKPLFYLHNRRLVTSQHTPPKIVNGKYSIEKFSFNNTIIKTKTKEESFLCFLDNYDQFWSAYVDNQEVKIHRANFCFKAIKLPAGEHTVSWVYNPYPIKIAYLAFYLLLVVYLFYIRKFKND